MFPISSSILVFSISSRSMIHAVAALSLMTAPGVGATRRRWFRWETSHNSPCLVIHKCHHRSIIVCSVWCIPAHFGHNTPGLVLTGSSTEKIPNTVAIPFVICNVLAIPFVICNVFAVPFLISGSFAIPFIIFYAFVSRFVIRNPLCYLQSQLPYAIPFAMYNPMALFIRFIEGALLSLGEVRRERLKWATSLRHPYRNGNPDPYHEATLSPLKETNRKKR